MAIERLRKHLLGALGTDALLSDAADTAPYCTDWLNKWHGKAAMVVRPQNTQQVAYVHKMCAELRIPIVTQGGNTGMSGGATPNDSGDQVVISMTRMQRIRSIDPLNQTMTVDAGLLLAHAREAACNVGMQLPMALGSEGSCTIGGNIATNAGAFMPCAGARCAIWYWVWKWCCLTGVSGMACAGCARTTPAMT